MTVSKVLINIKSTIKDAYVKNETGEKIIDFHESNLHIVNYSIPVDKDVDLKELDQHLHSLPQQPDAIPYLTSYFDPSWGFCITENKRSQLKDGIYSVKVDSSIEDGSLSYADLLIKGESEKEILISTYTCHPSMANNELSGPLVLSFLHREIAKIIEVGELKYNVNLIYHNGKVVTREISVPISKIPKEPPEPSKNLSMSVGNKTVTPKTFKVPKPIGKLLVAQVKKVKPRKFLKINKKVTKRGFRK